MKKSNVSTSVKDTRKNSNLKPDMKKSQMKKKTVSSVPVSVSEPLDKAMEQLVRGLESLDSDTDASAPGDMSPGNRRLTSFFLYEISERRYTQSTHSVHDNG